MIRGYLALVYLFLGLLVLDPFQRFVLAPWVRFRPSSRIAVFGRWQQFMARFVLGSVSRIGGARIPEIPQIPGDEGVLVLMNHQSVLDIPLVVASLEWAYPRIVTRRRYVRWIPLVSHMVRLYQYPVVDPRANRETSRRMAESIAEAARTSDVPIAIFPEGTRTKDGEIGNFKKTGLRMILGSRPWTVYVLVADGFWERAKAKHFVRGLRKIDGRIELMGPIRWDDPDRDPDPFIRRVREMMVDKLAEMRQGVSA